MKSTVSRILISLFIFSQLAFGQAPVQSRIQGVEQGLLPAVIVKGNPGWAIQERMACLCTSVD